MADPKRMIFGVGPVRELLEAAPGSIAAIHAAPSRAEKGRGGQRDPVASIVEAARTRGISVQLVKKGELDSMAPRDARHQGVIAVAKAYEYAHVDDMLDRADERGEAALIVALDGVTDPRNLGAIARSAYLLGAHGIIVPRDRAAEVTPVAVKASAGATEHLLIAQVTNLARTLVDLKEAGLWNAAIAAGPEAQTLAEFDATIPLCLVMGAEGRGIRPLVRKRCDFAIEIPMARSGVGSFNVSVAAAIALYEAARQRG